MQNSCAAASGWDTSHHVYEFHVPHVVSHANMLFKRAIFMTGQRVVIFSSRHKIDQTPGIQLPDLKSGSDLVYIFWFTLDG